MKSNLLSVHGLRFGRLIVVGEAERVKGRKRVSCVCDCGNETTVDPRLLVSGKTKSCGCLQRAAVAQSSRDRATHGMSRTPEYQSWIHMKMRCTNKTDKKYEMYGGRGVSVSARWLDSFENFYQDMGPIPKGCNSIDRIDVNGNYEKSNCRWANPKMQSQNKRNTRVVDFNGEKIPLSVACELAGINYRSAIWRLNNGKNWMPLPQPPKAEE